MAAHGNIQVGVDILSTTRDEGTKTITAQIGDVVGEEVDADNAEIWQQPGLASRPSKAEPKKAACQAVVIRETGHDVCIAMRDVRGQEIAGNLKEGETCVYSGGADNKAQARSLWKADGSISHVTFVGNDPSGATIGQFIQASGNIDTVAKDACLLLRPSAARLFTPNASVSLEGDDFKVYAAGKANLNASTIVLGGATAQPTLNASDLTALIGALNTFAAAVATVEGTNSPPPTGASVFATAVTAFSTSLSAIATSLANRKTRND